MARLPHVSSRATSTRAAIVTVLALAGPTLGCPAWVDYEARARYPKDEPHASEARSGLRSAHLSRFGDEPPVGEALEGPRLAEVLEPGQDRVVMVFARELDPLSIDPHAFAILRADGRRVRPIRAVLAPANESDENRSLILLGNFGAAGSSPVAVHVIGSLYAESGEPLAGLDGEITGPEVADTVVASEVLEPAEGRCVNAAQVVRLYWTDLLTGADDEDLARIELGLADGRTIAPSGFDDHEPPIPDSPGVVPGSGAVAHDNVLDLCVAEAAGVVSVRAPAGLFEDEAGHPSAAVVVELAKLPSQKASE